MHNKSSISDRIEETIIAVLLGLMTLITFTNVVVRKAFSNDPPAFIEFIKLENIGLWGNELTVFMFGWLCLLGASYAVKKHAHLGVDAMINLLEPKARRILALVSVAICIMFTIFLLKGSWDYWANFANLPKTTGRWFPTGFEQNVRGKGWYEVESVSMPGSLTWLAGIFNDGVAYEKLPRLVPYFVLPLSMAMLLFRYIQAAIAVWKGEIDRLIASHEVEDELEQMRAQHEEQAQ